MPLTYVFPCLVCDDRHETNCPACHGMGLLKAEHGAGNEWNLCQRCAGSGVVGCPVCLDDKGVLRPFPPFCGEPPGRGQTLH
jgi:DnaJ-class molecular chaperone